MSPIISVENLGKKYTLRHQGGGPRYRRLSEELVNAVKWPFRKSQHERDGRAGQEEFWALRDVSFEVQEGEVLGIIGRNGAGKSTLLKVLSRITEPSKGTVTLRGRVASLLEVGTGFHPELTGRENIFLNGAILGMSRTEIRDKFDEIVTFAEVEKFLDTPVKHYSSGMYVRLAFAVAAHLEPEILVVDEVLAVGDMEFQKKCLGKMSQVASCGRTVLFVSHNMQTVRGICQRVLLFDKGSLSLDDICSRTVAEHIRRSADRSSALSRPTLPKGPLALTDVFVTDREGNHQGSFSADEPIVLNFLLVCRDPIDSVNLGFSIHSEAGNTIGICYSAPAQLFALPDGNSRLCAELQCPPLTPGIYTIRARVERKMVELDWPRGDLAEFEVSVPPQFLGRRPETLHNGQVILSPSWLLTEPMNANGNRS